MNEATRRRLAELRSGAIDQHAANPPPEMGQIRIASVHRNYLEVLDRYLRNPTDENILARDRALELIRVWEEGPVDCESDEWTDSIDWEDKLHDDRRIT